MLSQRNLIPLFSPFSLETFLKYRTEHNAALCNDPIMKLVSHVLCHTALLRYPLQHSREVGPDII